LEYGVGLAGRGDCSLGEERADVAERREVDMVGMELTEEGALLDAGVPRMGERWRHGVAGGAATRRP
jgi:hypothetical protein